MLRVLCGGIPVGIAVTNVQRHGVSKWFKNPMSQLHTVDVAANAITKEVYRLGSSTHFGRCNQTSNEFNMPCTRHLLVLLVLFAVQMSHSRDTLCTAHTPVWMTPMSTWSSSTAAKWLVTIGLGQVEFH